MIYRRRSLTLVLMRKPHWSQLDSGDGDLVAQIVAAEQAGDPENARRRFEDLYVRHAPRIISCLCATTSRGEAEDIAQEAWLRAWARLGTYTEKNFSAWVLKIAKNHLIDQQRKRKAVRISEEVEVVDRSSEKDCERSDHEERARILKNCLSKLDEKRRKLIASLLEEEFSYETISQELGISTNAAYKLKHEARKLVIECYRRATK